MLRMCEDEEMRELESTALLRAASGSNRTPRRRDMVPEVERWGFECVVCGVCVCECVGVWV
jgi:hypothetical protein